MATTIMQARVSVFGLPLRSTRVMIDTDRTEPVRAWDEVAGYYRIAYLTHRRETRLRAIADAARLARACSDSEDLDLTVAS